MSDVSVAVSASFEQIVRQQDARVLRVAFRVLGNWADAEDVAQEVFVRLHRHGISFNSETGLAAWLYRVTVNLCFDRVRSSRPMQELPELACAGPSAEASVIREEQKRRLMAALAELPVRERAAVVLREIEGLSTAEVAEAMGSAEGTVRSQISKALVRLRGILGGEER